MNEDLDQEQEALAAEAQRNDELRRRELLRTVDFGLQVQSFLDSAIGQRILSDAEVELKEIANELFRLDPLIDTDRMRVLLNRAGVLRHWQDQFAEYIIAGRNAEREAED